jgi:AraC-like DNA-binding protein
VGPSADLFLVLFGLQKQALRQTRLYMKQSKVKLSPRRKFVLFVGWKELAHLFGMTAEELLREARLPMVMAEETHLRLTTEEVMNFWDALERKVGGRKLTRVLCSAFNELLPAPYLAALCCKDLRGALKRFAECKPFTGPIRFRLEDDEGRTSLYYDWAIPLQRMTPSFVLAELKFVLVLAERGTGQVIRPLSAESPLADYIDQEAAFEFLGIPVTYGPEMRLVFAESDLERPLKTANSLTLQILEKYFSEIYATGSEDASEQVRMLLQRLMLAGAYSLENVANEMNCSVRSLQRALADEGISFQELLVETRRDLSIYYMKTAQYSIKETAFMLGYSEPAAFNRAFRSWTGKTPTNYLKQAQ